MPKVSTFLMFEGVAEEALVFYTAIFSNSKIVRLERYPDDSDTPTKIKLAVVQLGDMRLMLTDSPVMHEFTFTPSTSLFVDGTEEEIDDLYDAFMDEGTALMALGDHGFSTKFAWVQDRYGVSWQLNVPLCETTSRG